jgi:hypothetical protein
MTRQRGKGNSRASTSEPAAKAVKVFTAAGGLERKRKAEEGTTEQLAQLKEPVYRLLKNHDEQNSHPRVAAEGPYNYYRSPDKDNCEARSNSPRTSKRTQRDQDTLSGGQARPPVV